MVGRHDYEGILHHACLDHLVIDTPDKAVYVGYLIKVLLAFVAVAVAGSVHRVELDEHELRLMAIKVFDDLVGLGIVASGIHVYVQP